ncbi:MAG: hypothetical protein KAR38_13030 [Calditrichia bacterium]|nr:hypothetical protein [Calditrichia bacterium]
MFAATAFAGGPELKPYGFVKGDLIYVSGGVYSWGNPDNNYISSPQLASGIENAALGYTAQHTRLGLKGTTGEDYKVGGRIELDFYVGRHDANGNPRMRLAYVSVAKDDWEIRFGQQWDIFSPINAATNNTNANMWYAGNMGFRRGQIQFIYKLSDEGVKPMVQLSLGEATKEAGGPGADNLSKFPMLQGRVSAKLMEKHTVGVYFAYAKHTPDPDTTDYDFNTTGFGVDFNLPFTPKFTLKGEVNMGTNMNNANLFTAAGSGNAEVDAKNLGVWANAIVKPNNKVNFVGGFGMDKNQTDDLAAGDKESNMVIYGDVIFPIANGFSFSVELGNISTKIKDGDTHSALFGIVSGKVSF